MPEHLAGDGIDQLVFEAVTCAAIHLPEGDAFRSGRGGIERDRTGHERKLEKAVPVSTRQRNTPIEDTPNLGDYSRDSTEKGSCCFAGRSRSVLAISARRRRLPHSEKHARPIGRS